MVETKFDKKKKNLEVRLNQKDFSSLMEYKIISQIYDLSHKIYFKLNKDDLFETGVIDPNSKDILVNITEVTLVGNTPWDLFLNYELGNLKNYDNSENVDINEIKIFYS